MDFTIIPVFNEKIGKQIFTLFAFLLPIEILSHGIFDEDYLIEAYQQNMSIPECCEYLLINNNELKDENRKIIDNIENDKQK